MSTQVVSQKAGAGARAATDTVPEKSAYDSVVQSESKRARREWITVQGLRLGVGVLVIAAWWIATSTFVDPFYISTPRDVAVRLWDWASTDVLWTNLWATMKVTIGGFLLGTITGAIVGFVLGVNRRLASVLDPWLQAVYSIPKIALAPVFILWFGIGDQMRIQLTGMMVFFIVFWTTYAAVKAVDRELIEVVRLMGGNKASVTFKVVAPGAMPGLLLGVKMAVPYALIGAVVAELLASSAGIGYLMQRSASQYDTAGLMAGLVVLMVVAVLLNVFVTLTDHYLNRWQPEHSG